MNSALEGNGSDLYRLRRLDAREAWKSEPLDFSQWVFHNVDVLNEALGLEIELTSFEEPVGRFSVDLFGHEVQTGHPVEPDPVSRTVRF